MRALILELLYDWSKKPYQKYIKKTAPWPVSLSQLMQYSNTSLGFHLACFLLKNNFQLQPKLEDHDVFHVLTNTGTTVPAEISMQYYLLGNGKRSLYLYTVIILGTLLYADYGRLFLKAYRQGKSALVFYHIDFLKLLDQPIKRIQNTFLIH